jgi:hypothetical protein
MTTTGVQQGSNGSGGWHLDRRVPITILALMSLQLILLVSFFVGLDWRVKSLESQAVTDARVAVIEANLMAVDRDLSRLEQRTVVALEDIRNKLERIDKRLQDRGPIR